MEPKHNSYQSSTELPHPQEGMGLPSTPQSGEARPAAPERAIQPPNLPSGQPLQPVTGQPQQAQAATSGQPISQPTPGQSTGPSDTNNLIADDLDLIEKEWVVKAKAIVSKTKDDPYQQNRVMTQFRADYMKKRYNKDLKLNNEN